MYRTETDFPQNSCSRWFADLSHNVKNAAHGWKLYFTHPVCPAGLALSCFYMTVLGLDNITYGFCMAQCVTESILGGLVGLSAIIGIFGSLAFPVLRRKVGLHKTGLIGFGSVISTLTLCVVSIWLPGSPFEPFYFQKQDITINNELPQRPSTTLDLATTTTITNISSLLKNETSSYIENSTLSYLNQSEVIKTDDSTCYVSSFISVSVLLVGIILHRFGLWVSDLTITQTLQVIS